MSVNKMEEEGRGSVNSTVAYDDEAIIWSGKPSQWINFGTFLWWGILIVGAIVFLYVWGRDYQQDYTLIISQVVSYSCKGIIFFGVISITHAYLSIFYQETEITRNKIKESKGITRIFQQDKFAEISDINGFKSPAAGILGLVGLCTLIIETNDSDQPIIRVRAIPTADREQLIGVLQPIWRKLKIERKGYFGN